jgi:MFS family permease
MSSFRVIRETFSNRNLAVLTVTQTLFMFTAFLWWPYRSLFILELGASKELLGMLLMLETLSQIVFQLPGGVLADRLGRKKVIVYSSIIRIASPIVYLFSTHWTHTAPGLVLASAGMLGMPALNALIAESLPMESRSSGFAAYRTVTWMPMIVTSLLGGVFMDAYGVIRGVRICLLAMLVVSIASAILRWRYITETLDTSSTEKARTAADTSRQRSLLQGLLSMPREVLVLTAVAALSGFSMRIVWSFMVVYAVEVVGVTKTQWGMIGTVMSIISTALTFPGGVLADRIGRKPCITISRILSPLSTIGFTYSTGFWQLLSVNALGGVAQGFGGLVWGPMGGPVWQALVADLTPPEDRGRMMGLMGSISGLVSTPASWVGGYMYDNISPALPFQASFALDVVGTIVFVAFLKEPKKSTLENKIAEG